MKGLFQGLVGGKGIEVRFLDVGDGAILKKIRSASFQANPLEMGPEGAVAHEIDGKSDAEWDRLANSRESKSIVAFENGEPVACLTLRRDLDKTRLVNDVKHDLCYVEHLFVMPGKRNPIGILLPIISMAREHIQNTDKPTLVMVAVMALNSPMVAMLKTFGFKYDREGEHDRNYSQRDQMEFYSLTVKPKPDELGREVVAMMDGTDLPKSVPIIEPEDGKRIVMAPPKPPAAIAGITFKTPGWRR